MILSRLGEPDSAKGRSVALGDTGRAKRGGPSNKGRPHSVASVSLLLVGLPYLG